MRLIPILVACAFFPASAFAVGSDDSTAPATTKTTTECTAGQVYDEATQSCLDAKSEHLDKDAKYRAVRELAYGGHHERALLILAAMSPDDSRVLTYRGYIARKQGRMIAAMAFYTAALEANADNILARSYMAQGLLLYGQRSAAEKQLAEIRKRGGADSWAATSLEHALKTGRLSAY